MQISISGRHLDITQALREYVAEKGEKRVRRFDHVTNTHGGRQVVNARHTAEAPVHASGAAIPAPGPAEDMSAAIASRADKLDRPVIKHKEKLTDHHRGDESLKQMPG